MANTTQMNLNVKKETKQIVRRIAELTHRNPGQVLDLWAAEQARIMSLPHTDAPTEENNFAGLREE